MVTSRSLAKSSIKDEKKYERNLKKVHTSFIGQCTTALSSGMKSATAFTEKNKKNDLIWSMNLIRNLSIGINETEFEVFTTHQLPGEKVAI